MADKNMQDCAISKWRKLYIAIILITFFIMQISVGYHPFWGDEVAQVGFVGNSSTIMQSIGYCLSAADITPPLFNIISTVWYRLVPSTERFLLMLTEIIVCISIYMNALIGLKLKNPKVGLYICMFMGTSVTLFDSVAFEFRTYALFLFFSTLTLLVHIKNLTEKKDVSYRGYILFGLSLMGLLFSHYYGAFIFVAFFFADVYLFFTKRVKLKAVISYIIAGIPFFIWSICFIIKKQDTSFFGEPNLHFSDFFKTLFFLLGNNAFLFLLFLFATALVLSKVCPNLQKTIDRTWYQDQFYFNFLVLTIWAVIATLYCYGAFVSPQYVIFGSRIMIPRYFTGLIPFAFFLSAVVLDNIFECVNVGAASKCINFTKISCIAIYLGLMINLLQNVAIPNIDPYNPQDIYNRSASWLLAQEDILDEDTLLIFTESSVLANGFIEHYFDKSGYIDHIQAKSMWEVQSLDYKQYNTIYFIGIWGPPKTNTIPTVDFLSKEYGMAFSDDLLKLKVFKRIDE